MVTKIKDGFFISDLDGAQDAEFIELNKITRIINTAGTQVPNIYAHHGIRYLTLNWEENGTSTLFDPNGVLIKQINFFIDQALSKGECILIHSVDGRSRSVVCALAYLMFHYWWSLEKAWEYIGAKKYDLQPKGPYIQQLHLLDKRLRITRSQSSPEELKDRLSGWIPHQLNDSSFGLCVSNDQDEVILLHTYLNSRPPSKEIKNERRVTSKDKKRRLKWIDEVCSSANTTAKIYSNRDKFSLTPKEKWLLENDSSYNSSHPNHIQRKASLERPPNPSYSSLIPEMSVNPYIAAYKHNVIIQARKFLPKNAEFHLWV